MKALLLFLIAVGCGTSDTIALTFVTPTAGTSATRDQLGATGDLVARVDVEVVIEGAPARVGLVAADVAQPDLVDGIATVDLATTGTVTFVATAYDTADVELAVASVDVAIGDAMPASCQDALALYQIDFTIGPTQPGVDDPVTATPPLNGVPYRVLGNATPRETMFADCTLILSLAKAAPIMRAQGVVEVSDLGIYNYRCIGGGPPPNCPNGISQHAFAKAIDIAAVTYDSGETAVVNDDWVIDPNAEDTCAAPTEPGKDQQLHELICALKTASVWNIVLTPNYNAAHRNHFHVDLTPDSNFIEKRSH